MSINILITGASGLIGSALTDKFKVHGYNVSHLGRKRTSKNGVKSYIWNIAEGFIEEGALESANIVVHLAGAGVADKRWTRHRKKEIKQSRVQSTELLHQRLAAINSACETFISASAIGIYGLDTGDSWLTEDDPPGDGFLAEVTEQWERQIARIEGHKLRVVVLRTGIVLSAAGGALPKIAESVKWNVGAALGSGRQYMSWIHMEDLCGIFLKAVTDPAIRGAYNAVAPNPVTNRAFTEVLAKVLNKKLWLPAVPGAVLRLGLGEMAQMVLGGNRVSPDKIEKAGYQFYL